MEFEYARAGMSSLETAYAVIRTLLPELSAEKTVELFSRRPRELFGLEQPSITEGQTATLSFFDPAGETRLEENTTRSKSKNSPFIGKTLRGRVLGILNRGKPSFKLIQFHQEMAEPKKMSIALRYGLIAAACLVLLTLGTYWAGPEAFVGPVAFLGYPLLIGCWRSRRC